MFPEMLVVMYKITPCLNIEDQYPKILNGLAGYTGG